MKARWRTSSFTGGDDCVMVRGDLAALRDSKDKAKTVLPAGNGAVARLVAFVRA